MAGVTDAAMDADSGFAWTDSDSERTRLGGAIALVASAAFVATAGLPGIAAGLAVVVGWALAGGVYAFVLGQVGVVAFLAGGSVAGLVVVEVTLLGVLLAPAVELAYSVAPVALALGWTLAGSALAWAVARSLVGLPSATFLFLILTALAAYGLHRYQLVSVGLEGEPRE